MVDTSTPRPQPAGGFLPPTARTQTTLPSPAPSTASSRAAARLPAPRSKPLAPGSRKEDYARDYVAQRLLHVSRRFVKKHGIPATAAEAAADLEDSSAATGTGAKDEEMGQGIGTGPGPGPGPGPGAGRDKEKEVPGYDSVDQMCADLEEVVDVLWFSGTPSLQIPYLLNVASALTTYLAAFPPSPRPTFALLQKLDHCFASLLVGRDVKTRDPLPGFAVLASGSSSSSGSGLLRKPSAAGLSRTDMVRVKSIADETRMLVAVVMSGEADVEDIDDDGVGQDDDEGTYDAPPTTGLQRRLGRGARGRFGKRDRTGDDDKILDPFEAHIDPGEGVVYRLKPEGDYGGFVADEETDDDDDDDDDDFAAAGGVRLKKGDKEEGGKREDEEDEDEDEDEDGEEDEFVDVAQPKMIPKRKVDDDVDLSAEEEAEEVDPKKRIKVKGEQGQETPTHLRDLEVSDGSCATNNNNEAGDGSQMKEGQDNARKDTPRIAGQQGNDDSNNNDNSNSRTPPRPPATIADINDNGAGFRSNDDGNSDAPNTNRGNTATAAAAGTGQQFHFALDDDDDDSEGETLPNTTTRITATATATAAAPITDFNGTIGTSSNGNESRQQQLPPPPRYRRDEGYDDGDEVTDEEEEELHMNVARVYEKTLMQLGKSLGESIL
ncbi:hypothetical protein SLS62_003094 [Diatrype stigma]|uniref:Uncharacterized protein n=1 Tax=Diatrype stigma TaxID=117547 RepID=A0AAN9UTM5_9PEZI